jgi:hypothetical protein
MKKKTLLFALLLSLFSIAAAAQSGYVTAVGTIPNYAGGQLTANFQNQSSAPQLPLLNGSVFPTQTVTNLDVNGHFTTAIADNLIITPTPSQWQFILCSKPGNPSQPCYPVTITITCVDNGSCSNGTLDITSAFNGAPAPPTPPNTSTMIQLIPKAQYPGQIASSIANGYGFATQPNLFLSQPGDTVTSIENQCASAPCTYMVTTPQTITLSSNHTLSGNVNLFFLYNGSWTVNGSSYTLTIPANVQGALSTHFLGTSRIQFGNMQPAAPVEWFGAIGDWNGTSGTDDTAAIQACINAITYGQCVLQNVSYEVSSALSISKSNVGIRGVSMAFASATIYPTPVSSTIITTNSSADIIDVFGTSPTNTITFNQFQDFAMQRAVAPSGAAAGLSLNYTYGVWVTRVSSEDSIEGFYVHGSGSQGVAAIVDCVATNGYRGLNEAGLTLYGWDIDSSDGISSNSFRTRHSFYASNLGTTATTTGYYIHGTTLNDQMVYGFESANATYGEQIIQTATGDVIASSDIHFWGVINDGYYNTGIYISGLTTNGSGRVEINGGYIASARGNTSGVDIENSVGVNVSNVQFGAYSNSYNNAIYVHNSQDIQLIGNNIQSVQLDGIVIGTSTAVTVTGNNLKGLGAGNGLIRLASSSLNAIMGNTMTGTGQSLVVDAASTGNTGLGTNTIASTLTAASVLGLNPTTNDYPGAPTGACSNGSTIGNSTTTAGTYPSYVCRNNTWVGQGTVY